jgi:hypothetical protein
LKRFASSIPTALFPDAFVPITAIILGSLPVTVLSPPLWVFLLSSIPLMIGFSLYHALIGRVQTTRWLADHDAKTQMKLSIATLQDTPDHFFIKQLIIFHKLSGVFEMIKH